MIGYLIIDFFLLFITSSMSIQIHYDYEQRERLRDSSGMRDSGRTKDRKGTIRR